MVTQTLGQVVLKGPGGEPVDLWRTMQSHGVTELPPQFVDPEARTLTTTLAVPGGSPRTVTISAGRSGRAVVAVNGRLPGAKTNQALLDRVRHILRLDADLSDFYEVAAADPDLAWAAAGAGRMMRSSTVFEDVIKTVCTTNCTWSATIRMVNALVEHLGEPARSAPATGPEGRAFPTPEAMASAEEAFYKETVRSGYRGPYFISIARAVANGELELEQWGRADAEDLPDDELAKLLLALPGVGPYAAAHIMMMMGRYSRLILDSWTRPTYARLVGRKTVTDAAIERRFKRYGPYAGLAFWLFLTRHWVDD